MSGKSSYCLAFVGGGCSLKSCKSRHDIRRCSCGLVVPLLDFDQHSKGRRHQQLLVQNTSQIPAPNPANEYSIGPQPTTVPSTESIHHCEVCDRDVPIKRLESHVKHNKTHLSRQRSLSIEGTLQEAASDKYGITVGCREGIDFGIIEPEAPQRRSVPVVIYKADPEARVRLSGFRLTYGTRFSVRSRSAPGWIHTDRPIFLTISFDPSHDGRDEDNLELVFFDVMRRQCFIIIRRICAIVGSKDDYERLKPTAPFVRRRFTPLQSQDRIVPASRPPTWSNTKWAVRLAEYKALGDLVKAIYSQDNHSTRDIKNFLPSLSIATYGGHFQVLLWIEEEKMKQDLDQYSMLGTPLIPNGTLYDLEVEGLTEGRPSVLVGDSILVRLQETPEDPWFEGFVHKVQDSHVSLRFGSNFSTYRGNKFDVRFVLNRLPLRRMHQAVTTTFNPARLLFPGPEHVVNSTRTPFDLVTPINRRIGEDIEQLETVGAILHQPPGSPPFVVFGPPGTGKTVTIVEAIRQLLISGPDVRILACAPSNSAADLIAQALTDLGRSQIFRLNSISRTWDDLPKTLREFSLVNDNLVFAMPSLDTLQSYRVVVCTCVSAAVPYGLGMKRGHFSHIFIDEAGQGKEPEVMIPIKTMAGERTNVILAGDNQQLGPIVHSPIAGSLGLKHSYLSRIMAREIYDLTLGRGRTIVKLVKNFRSHPAILDFPNSRFYKGELQACGNPVLTHSLEQSNELVTKRFPLIFHSIVGKDEREGSSPSFFNVTEATLVKKYCLSLTNDRKNRLRPEHIGVITPYHGQCCKIRQLLSREHKLTGIKVGSVEEFQGQERRVIILSTVRSSTDYVNVDINRALGFVANPRRFNVAITRAQALLVVIGNPVILGLDPLWRAFLNYIHSRGGWKGKGIEWNPEDPVHPGQTGYDGELRQRAEGEVEDMIARLKALIVQKSDDFDVDLDFSDDSGLDNHLDGPAVFRREDE